MFDDAGQQKKTIGSVGRCDGQVNYPSGLFIKGNMLYASDFGRQSLHTEKLNTGGQVL